MWPATSRTLQVGHIDLPNTLQMIGIHRLDPTFTRGPGHFARAVLTPDGPGTMRLTWDASGDVTAEAWGSGADWLIERRRRAAVEPDVQNLG